MTSEWKPMPFPSASDLVLETALLEIVEAVTVERFGWEGGAYCVDLIRFNREDQYRTACVVVHVYHDLTNECEEGHAGADYKLDLHLRWDRGEVTCEKWVAYGLDLDGDETVTSRFQGRFNANREE